MGYALTYSTQKYIECNTNSLCLVKDSLQPLTQTLENLEFQKT